ncbi:peptidoglycan-associated lipoprotein [Crenobacter luteus]|uniref:Peptidoglycan-associated lipoprotein n=1 Tax=Crenobacter luteus TaxID=1452487 RepID=A0A161SJN2_9NEIS|nr:peptidoglycan-associated lipoprotein Pal [Crenobacter luteus]KZE34330.1 peptidoglycan-associated lipoprotein [Crenobacter luteus]TCP15206.1 peptidoglycan-associated lipoprotein [Crenobacter luteus]
MNWKTSLIGLSIVAALAACSSTKPADAGAAAAGSGATIVDGSGAGGAGGAGALDPLKDPNSPLAKRSVYFDFDSSALRDADKATVSAHAGYLAGRPEQAVQIQGNTDARGSREYNLALGQRRAEAVKKSLQVLGVKESQVEAVSYGKEKPRATGNSEADHAENRRADIVYDGR